jgi:hypothetical protein
MEVRIEEQIDAVEDEVSAVTAVVRPILTGILYAVKGELIQEAGGYQRISLEMLSRIYKPGSGECGITFEYAIHDAIRRGESSVVERLVDAMSHYCKVPGKEINSILFGAEKRGTLRLIDTAEGLLTEESRLLAGSRGQPAKLKYHIRSLASAFRIRELRSYLPQSISGLWKADLFTGFKDTDRWVGITIKTKQQDIESAKGLRIGIVPANEGRTDRIQLDDQRNIVICPIPYDGAFVETFYKALEVVRMFIQANAQIPKEIDLPRPPSRTVARYLADRRRFPVLEVIDSLAKLAQPELISSHTAKAQVIPAIEGETSVDTAISPHPKLI